MGARSEQVIQLEEREVKLLFTNRALADAETQLGKTVIAIAQGFQAGQSGLVDVATLLRVGMEAARRENHDSSKPVSLQDAYEVMDAVGFAEVASVVMNSVADIIGYSSKNV